MGRGSKIAVNVAAGLIGLTTLLFGIRGEGASDTAAYAAPGLEPLTVENAKDDFWACSRMIEMEPACTPFRT